MVYRRGFALYAMLSFACLVFGCETDRRAANTTAPSESGNSTSVPKLLPAPGFAKARIATNPAAPQATQRPVVQRLPQPHGEILGARIAIGELRGAPTPAGAALLAAVSTNSWTKFIQWVSAVAADGSGLSQREKVIRNRPADLVDGCWTYSTNPQFIAEPQNWSRMPDSQYNTLWPSYSNPLKEAGGPLAANAPKCVLKPIDLKDYAASFTRDELAQLQTIFPNGVCDWSKPGVGFHRVVPWSSFGPSPVNQQFDVTTGTTFYH